MYSDLLPEYRNRVQVFYNIRTDTYYLSDPDYNLENDDREISPELFELLGLKPGSPESLEQEK